MCCAAVKSKNNYVRDLRFAKHFFFLFTCEYEWEGKSYYVWHFFVICDTKQNMIKSKELFTFMPMGSGSQKQQKSVVQI